MIWMMCDAWEVDHTTGETSPTVLNSSVGSFFDCWKKDEGDKTNGLTSLPSDTITLTETRSQIAVSMISPLFFSKKRPWLSVRPGFEPTTSCSADRCSPNWANWVADVTSFKRPLDVFAICLLDLCTVLLRIFQKLLMTRWNHHIIS